MQGHQPLVSELVRNRQYNGDYDKFTTVSQFNNCASKMINKCKQLASDSYAAHEPLLPCG